MGIPPGSLPAPFSAGFNNGYATALTVVVHLGGGDALYMITRRNLTIAPLSLTVKYGVKNLTPLYDYYRPHYIAASVDGSPVDGVGDIDFGLNIDDNGGLAARSEARLTLLNMPLNGERLDWLLSMFDIENYDVEIWEGYIPLSGTLQIDTDMILRFRGVIRDGAEYDHRVLTVRAFDRRDVENPMVPKYLINKTDTPTADEHYLGKPYPMPCGDYHTDNIATQTVGSATMDACEMGTIHALPTVRTAQGSVFYLSDHAVASLSRSVNPVYFRTPGAKNWVVKMIPSSGLSNFLTFTENANGSTWMWMRTGLGEAFVFPSILGANNSDAVFDQTDLDVTLNDDLSDYVTVAYPNVFSMGLDSLDVAGDFVNAEDVSGGFGSAVDFYIYIVTSSRTGTVECKVFDRELGTTVNKGTINADKWSVAYDMPAGSANFSKLGSYDFEIRPQSGGSIRIHRLYCKARVRPSLSFFSMRTIGSSGPRSFGNTRAALIRYPEPTVHNDGIFISGNGAKYGSWISDGGRTVGHASGDTIANPAYYIEFLLRNYAGVASARIDTASFDVCGNTTNGTRKDWVCKGVNLEQKQVFEIARQVAHEHGMKLLYDHDSNTGTDVHRLISIPHRDDAAALTLTDAEIMVDERGVPLIRISKTPQSQIVNAYAARFKYNFTIDDFSDDIYLDDLNNDGDVESSFADDTGSPRLNSYLGWCEGSISTYMRRVLDRVEFRYIDDAATAERRLKLYLDWYAYQRMIVTVRVLKTLDTVGLRMGDVVIIDHPLLNDLHQNFTKFVVDRIAYPPIGETMQPYIELTCQEIPNQYTGMRVIRGIAALPSMSITA